MQFTGILIGAISFLSIGLFHPIVIKSEYYFTKSCWPVFAVAGLILVGASLFVENVILASALAVIGMSSWWSILELFEQEQRVKKGWFPANPKRAKAQEETAVEE
jgi:uncharacterized membrane protein YuzA (DUF378 family)